MSESAVKVFNSPRSERLSGAVKTGFSQLSQSERSIFKKYLSREWVSLKWDKTEKSEIINGNIIYEWTSKVGKYE